MMDVIRCCLPLIDEKSLFQRHGHAPVGAGLKQRFHPEFSRYLVVHDRRELSCEHHNRNKNKMSLAQ